MKKKYSLIKILFVLSLMIYTFFNNSIVKAESGEVLSFKDSPIYVYINSTKTIQPILKVNGKKVTPKNYNFKSQDLNIATVNEKGVVTAKKEGSTKITVTATYNNKQITNDVTVNTLQKYKDFDVFNGAPYISIRHVKELNGNTSIIIIDKQGLDPKNIHFYEAIITGNKKKYDKTKEITNNIVEKFEVMKTENGKNTKYKIILKGEYLKNKTRTVYVKIKDNTGKYNNRFITLKDKNSSYGSDSAARIGYWNADIQNNTISFVVKDYSGVKSVKVYDYYNKQKVVLNQKDFKNTSNKVTIDLAKLTTKNGYYMLKIRAEDKTSNQGFISVKFSIISPKISTASNKLTVGQNNTKNLDAKLTVGKTVVKDAILTYEISDPSIATVSSTGEVKGLKEGKAIITIKSNYEQKELNTQVELEVKKAEESSYKFDKNSEMYYSYKNNNKDDKGTGIIEINNKKYYFSPSQTKYNSVIMGEQITSLKYEQRIGWVVIGDYYYFFNRKYGENGYMITDAVVDEIKLGSDGRAILNDGTVINKNNSEKNIYENRKLKIMVRAADILNYLTKPDESESTKFSSCFNYFVTLMRRGAKYSSYAFPIPLDNSFMHQEFNYTQDLKEAKFFDIEMAIYPLLSYDESIKKYATGWPLVDGVNKTRRMYYVNAEAKLTGEVGNKKGAEVYDCFSASSGFAFLANALGKENVKVVFQQNQGHAWNSIDGKYYDITSGQTFGRGTEIDQHPSAYVKDVKTGAMYKRDNKKETVIIKPTNDTIKK